MISSQRYLPYTISTSSVALRTLLSVNFAQCELYCSAPHHSANSSVVVRTRLVIYTHKRVGPVPTGRVGRQKSDVHETLSSCERHSYLLGKVEPVGTSAANTGRCFIDARFLSTPRQAAGGNRPYFTNCFNASKRNRKRSPVPKSAIGRRGSLVFGLLIRCDNSFST